MSEHPRVGWGTPCHVTGVIDGDTVEVTIVRRLRVRLLDCWAPESRTLDPHEKVLGLASKESMKSIAGDRDATLFVPTHGESLQEIMTLGRVLGEVWIDGRNISEVQVERGHATATKS